MRLVVMCFVVSIVCVACARGCRPAYRGVPEPECGVATAENTEQQELIVLPAFIQVQLSDGRLCTPGTVAGCEGAIDACDVELGDIAVGELRREVVTIVNPSSINLDIFAVTIEGCVDAYVEGAPPNTVEPRSSRDVSVVVRATQRGPCEARLVISSNASNVARDDTNNQSVSVDFRAERVDGDETGCTGDDACCCVSSFTGAPTCNDDGRLSCDNGFLFFADLCDSERCTVPTGEGEGEGEGEGDAGDGWALAFVGGREVVSLVGLENDDVFVAVETSGAASIVANGATIVDETIDRQGCVFLRVSSTGEVRWHRFIAFETANLMFCSPIQRVGDAATLVVAPLLSSPESSTILEGDGVLVDLGVGEAAALSIGFADGAIGVLDLLTNTSGGSVVRTGNGTDVTMRFANNGDIVFDFGATSSVVFDDADWFSTAGVGQLVALETDVITAFQWNDDSQDILVIPWDDGTTTTVNPDGLFGAVIARIGAEGVRWAKVFDARESSSFLHATEEGVVSVGHMSQGTMLDARSGAVVAQFAPGSSSEGLVVELTNDGELLQTHELGSTLFRPGSLASPTALWLLSETLPVGAGRLGLLKLDLDGGFGEPLDIGDIVRTRRMSVAATEDSVMLGLTLADAADVTTLVPDATPDGDVVLVRPDSARLP